jgi:hypothetical protein
MKKRFYAIRHEGEKRRWFQLTGVDDDHPDGTGFTLVDEFNRLCILDEDQADAFLRRPGTDPRYYKTTVNIEALAVRRKVAK